MTLFYASGFEGNAYDDAGTTSGTVALDATGKITGTYSVHPDYDDDESSLDVLTKLNGEHEHYAYCKFTMDSLVSGTPLCRGRDTSSGFDCWRLDVSDTGGGNFYLTINLWDSGGANLENISSIVTNLAVDTEYQVEIHWIRTNDNTKGYIQVKLDGVLECTLEHSTSVGPVADYIQFGNVLKLWTDDAEIYFDDVWCNEDSGSYNNGWPGLLTFLYRRPDPLGAAGTHTDMTGDPDDANHANNWDEAVSDDDTSDNYSAALQADKETGPLPETDTGKTIRAVRWSGWFWNTNFEAAGNKFIMIDGGTEVEDTLSNLDENWNWRKGYNRETRPAGGVWTNAAVDGMEIGALAVADTDVLKGSQIELLVIHDDVNEPVAGGSILKLSTIEWASVKKAGTIAEASISKVSGITAN